MKRLHTTALVYGCFVLIMAGFPALAEENEQALDEAIQIQKPPETKAPEKKTKPEHVFNFEEDLDFKTDFPFDMNIFFSPGYQRTNLSSINTLMSQRGYAPFGEDLFSFGGGLQIILWNVISEWEGGGSFTAPVSNQDYWSQLNNGYFFWNLGYQFKPLKELSIYPLLGLGINSLELNFTQLSWKSDFEGFLDNPGWQGSVSNTLFAVNLGLGIDWHWGWFGSLGLRGGYIFTPLAGNWWSINDLQGDDEDRQGPPLSNGPALNLSGPYLRLNLGF